MRMRGGEAAEEKGGSQERNDHALYNLQGDVVALLDSNGNTVVEYHYDAWGKPTSTTGTLAATVGAENPFRYRGYVYDIVEKRFAETLGYKKTGGKMFSIALPKDVHRGYTNAWRINAEYGKKHDKKAILQAAIQVYGQDPELLGAAIYTITKNSIN